MKIIFRYSIVVFLLLISRILPQVENVPLTHRVYTFLKEMKVKNVIPYISEDVPNLSRFQVKDYLMKVEDNLIELSTTERNLFSRYKAEFYELLDPENTTYFFHPDKDFGTSVSEAFSDKVKYFYAFKKENANAFVEILGHYYFGQQFEPYINNTHLFDIGFRFHGTVFNHLGYELSVIKGGSAGDEQIAELIEPRVLQSFKWVEGSENIANYEFTEGYLKYYTEPVEDMQLSIQLGRENKTVGYGYGNKLILSGDNPPLDFIGFDFNYGIVKFTSIHGSTVGDFDFEMNERYTKYWAFNRFKLSFEKLFDIGIGETIVYSGRGFELGYLSPLGFYKFVEESLQDRDNANLYFDIQTNFIPNLEFQGTFFLDENILSNLQNLESYKNKTAYQLGAFWYEAFTLSNLSLVLEYTKVRPFVYSHINIQNTYTAWGFNLGHPIGPNADEIFSSIAYNLTDWVRLSLNHRFTRRGENIYSDDGDLIKNVGGDLNLTHGQNPENQEAIFLDGIRVNNQIFQVGIRIEPVRDFIFDLIYDYNREENISDGGSKNQSYGMIKFTLNY